MTAYQEKLLESFLLYVAIPSQSNDAVNKLTKTQVQI